VVGDRGLSDVDSGQNYLMKWRIAEPFRYSIKFHSYPSFFVQINFVFLLNKSTIAIVDNESGLIAIGPGC
jgi:hypothetical protein